MLKPTSHFFVVGDSRTCPMDLFTSKVQLVVTSPPYPMVSMWDHLWPPDWDEQHDYLSLIWKRLLGVPIICINIGDAVKNDAGEFKIYPNHIKIIDYFLNNGYHQLPSIIWKKPANSPTKFLGSGPIPCKAYVTLEHEHILIFRKNGCDKKGNRESAYFYEERNRWQQDIWNIHGDPKDTASFPVDIPWRLINMYSNIGDVVLDPFAGRGTTLLAAAYARRNSLSIDLDGKLDIGRKFTVMAQRHMDAKKIHDEMSAGKFEGHRNEHSDMIVKTRQETDIQLYSVDSIDATSGEDEPDGYQFRGFKVMAKYSKATIKEVGGA